MYRYLFVLPGKVPLALEETGGLVHYRAVQLFTLLARHFDRVVMEDFLGAVHPADLADRDLICFVPSAPGKPLVLRRVGGFGEACLHPLGPAPRLSLPRGELRVDAVERSPGTQPGQLLALLRTDALQVDWIPGTSRRRSPYQMRAVWLLHPEQSVYAGPTGKIRKDNVSARAEEEWL